jgi:trimethylamine:corrinoid methyltransferase-like protein
MPEMFDNNSINQWAAQGSVEITQRALKHACKLLSVYQEPVLDQARSGRAEPSVLMPDTTQGVRAPFG